MTLLLSYVSFGQAVTNVSLTKDTIHIVVGGIDSVKAVVTPTNAAVKTVAYSIEDSTVISGVATDSTYIITGLANGMTYVIVSTTDGSNLTDSVLVIVNTHVKSVSLTPNPINDYYGNSGTLTVVITPVTATDISVTFKSSDTTIVSVDAMGNYTLNKVGTAKIFVTTIDSSYKDTTYRDTTVVIVIPNVETGYFEDFDLPVDTNLWAPDRATTGSRLTFIVTQPDSTLEVNMSQSSFSDGQMYPFETETGAVYNISANPYLTLNIKVDSFKFWNISPSFGAWDSLSYYLAHLNLLPKVAATTMPLDIALFSNGVRVAQSQTFNLTANGWNKIVCNFGSDSANVLTAVDNVLFETVSWPFPNQATWQIDSFALGDWANVILSNSVTITSIIDSVIVGDSIQLTYSLLPANASIQGAYWTSNNKSLAKIDFTTPKYYLVGMAKGLDTVIVTADDESGATDTIIVKVVDKLTNINKVPVIPSSIYPVPAFSVLNISDPAGINTVVITDITGKVLISQQVNTNLAQIDVEDLAAGIYIIKTIKADGTISIATFTKQ